MKRYCFLPLVVCVTMGACSNASYAARADRCSAREHFRLQADADLACIVGRLTDAKRSMTAIMPALAVALTIITTSGLTAVDSAAAAARISRAMASDFVASFVTETRRTARRIACAERNTTMHILLIARGSLSHATNRTRRCDREARTSEPIPVFVSY